ncbi:MAG TPA: hypothetical protein VNO50_17955 [Pyrinomonadaceae bacterium]|nr:hypothetical protein [Pyrinomonadaceae bacterium]
MMNPMLKKIGVKHGMRSILVDAPAEALGVLDLQGDDVSYRLTGSFDYIHLFVKDREHLDATFPKLKSHLKTDGMLWVSWPKGRRLGTDLTLRNVIEIGYNHGLVESKTISIDSTWSAVKFTLPKEGKQYNNSYGQLKKSS